MSLLPARGNNQRRHLGLPRRKPTRRFIPDGDSAFAIKARNFAQRIKLTFPLLSDPDRAIARAYHALKEDETGIQRSVYVIARHGTIVCSVAFDASSML